MYFLFFRLPTSVIQSALLQQGADLSMYSPGGNLHIDDDMSNPMMDPDYAHPYVSILIFLVYNVSLSIKNEQLCCKFLDFAFNFLINHRS